MRSSTSPHAVAFARLAGLSLPGVRRGDIHEAPRRLACGVPALDRLLAGGWPRGRISEVYGPVSSGKTTFALASLAAATRRGEFVACIDAADALHPLSVAAAGACLSHILWIRPPSVRDALRCTDLILRGGGFTLVLLDLGRQSPRYGYGSNWLRLLRSAEKSHTALVIVAAQRLAGSFASLSLRLQAGRTFWKTESGCRTGQTGPTPPLFFDGFECRALLDRNKMGAPARQAVFQARLPAFLDK